MIPVPRRGEGERFLHPGEIAAAARPLRVRTLVGSCVAVTLWDPAARVGGINHFLLPRQVDGELGFPGRYADTSIRALIARVTALGASRARLQARVFGGASVLQALRALPAQLGERNVEAAVQVLGAEGVPVVETQVGGGSGRKVVFDLGDGTAFVSEV